jgi:NADH:ubiquinone oxidoreductase subunit K
MPAYVSLLIFPIGHYNLLMSQNVKFINIFSVEISKYIVQCGAYLLTCVYIMHTHDHIQRLVTQIGGQHAYQRRITF